MDGKLWRMQRIFSSDGHAVIIPIDHGVALGEIEGLRDPMGTLNRYLTLPIDGVLLTYGLNATSGMAFAGRDAPARILTADSFYGEGADLHYEVLVGADTAEREGFDAVKVIFFWDQSNHGRMNTVRQISNLISQAHQLAMPVMVEPTFLDKTRALSLSLGDAVRVAYEIGADILKVPFPGSFDILEKWVRSYHVPFLMLGGNAVASGDQVVDLVSHAMQVGVSGIVMGRNVWNRPGCEGIDLMQRLLSVVHS